MAFKALWLAAMVAGSGVAAEPGVHLATAEPALREVTLTGFTRARAELPLATETAGRVIAVAYDIGETIGKDGIFARLDATFIELELAEVEIRQERLRTRVAYDRREVKRHTELARRDHTSASQLDALEQALRDNGYELQVLGNRQKVLQERLLRTRIRAPAGWRITRRNLEPGQWVQEGENVGAAADFTTLIVPFALTPDQYGTLTDSDHAGLRLHLPDLKQDVAASIYRTYPGFDPVTRKIAVDLALHDRVEPHRGGLRARLGLRLPERTGAVTLPIAAVEHSHEELWVTREDGQRLRVILLGNNQGPDGEYLRVAAPDLAPGQRFRLLRED
ncbi:efflux RND transporter periplasmic adaptor subunit [Candidatus Thiosymbion oneisti]|uniref:efflux RND transporter periplasmic adaptor subunit n=1 Tax=Candidatus Thiosymbion oneisti TaxID=589554 RepID=UPI000B7E22D7|nr:HlyD family efflux transporter periplasmic adaptor subunit [Candidatus Thiosymbion oneisti]